MYKKDIYIKGTFIGQYTAKKDRSLSFSTEQYHNIKIDNGSVTDFITINAEEWDTIISNDLAQQSFFKKIKCAPQKVTPDFTGFLLNFDAVKVTNIQLKHVKKTVNKNSTGDIECNFYGLIKGERPKPVVKPKKVVVTKKTAKGITPKQKRNYTRRTENKGCLVGFFDYGSSSIGAFYAFVMLLLFLRLLFQTHWTALFWMIVFGITCYLLYKWNWLNNAVSKGLGCLSIVFSTLGFGLIIIGLLSVLLKQCDSNYKPSYIPPSHTEDDNESSTKRAIFKVQDSIKFITEKDSLLKPSEIDTLITHKRVWYNFKRKRLEIELSVKQSDVQNAYNLRENYRYINSYGPIYQSAALDNELKLRYVYNALDKLKQQHHFDDKAFLEAIITMVQDIPYRLVLSEDCDTYKSTSPNTSDFLSRCTAKCCIGNIKFGFQSPTEFIGNLYGDCDTRTVLLYTILKHYNYDIAIINSNQYTHSMLGISSEFYSGTYVTQGLKKYYFIETTAIGHYPGTLSSDMKNINLWKVVTY